MGIILSLLLLFTNLGGEKDNKGENNQYKFMEKLAYIESRGNPYIIGGYNGKYIGKYQFGQLVLKDMNFHMPVSKFKSNPKKYFPEHKQDSLCYRYLSLMKRRYFKDLIPKYNGKVIKGVVMNEATILAGGHFVGVGSMRKFLLSNGNYVPKDGWDTSLLDYIKYFQYISVRF